MIDTIMKVAGLVLGRIGSDEDKKRDEALLREQTDRQDQYAQNSVQWRVKDARKAGIHPLAALGMSPYNYKPQFIGGREGSSSVMSNQLMQYARAMETPAEKRLKIAQARRLEADTRAMGQGSVQGYGSAGSQGNVKVQMIPKQVVSDEAGSEPGVNPSSQAFSHPSGFVREGAMSEKFTDATEEDMFEKGLYYIDRGSAMAGAIKHWIVPNTRKAAVHRAFLRARRKRLISSGVLKKLAPGYEWRYHPGKGWKAVHAQGLLYYSNAGPGGKYGNFPYGAENIEHPPAKMRGMPEDY